MGKKVIVVGAGVIGASCAYQLARAGANVTVIDAGCARATDASFGWINASFYLDEGHFHLRNEAIAAYRRLVSDLPVPVAWSGCLCWDQPEEGLRDQAAELRRFDYPVEVVDREWFSELEPHVANPPDVALLMPSEAAAESGALADALLQAANGLGARVLTGLRVDGVLTTGDRTTGVATEVGPIHADAVLLAAGTATAGLAAQVDVALPMLQRPALVLQTRPVPPIAHHVLVSRLGEVRQCPDGSLLLPVTVGHQGADVDRIDGSVEEQAADALARLQSLFPATPLRAARTTLAHRPVPGDNFPVVGSAGRGLYLAVMHSGITLAALVGELVAAEILSGVTDETAGWLGDYRPGRFASH